MDEFAQNTESQEESIPKNTTRCYQSVARRQDNNSENAYASIESVKTIEHDYREGFHVYGLCPYWSVQARPHGANQNTLPMGVCGYLVKNDEEFEKEEEGSGTLYALHKKCGVSVG